MMRFEVINHRQKDFFRMLPSDWEEIIAPAWNAVKDTSTLYGIVEEGTIIAGGIVFRERLPEMTEFELKIGQAYFDRGFGYIGFLWVAENRRNEQLGSKWLTLLKNQDQKQGFWLTIEDEGLKKFYQKNGFETIAASEDKENMEWLCVYEPEIKQ
ncbi:GNAT family N-acetyltransferase [Sediminicola sp. 1XM1-17]|uniref:GNAT family N-acetyltransferase n=1 Tax=Sediminicola sp. 1XM1-17 TaxID=3127702 RepID=UPI003077AB8C